MNKKICFIAQFPPPIHGLSKAVDTLYNSSLADEFEFEKVDITDNKRFASNLITIAKSDADLFYFTISQTKGGNLRDLIILKLLRFQHKKCLIHLHGGYYRTLVDNDIAKWQRMANYREIKNISGAIVLGESLKWIFKGMISDDKIFVVPNCVDNEYLMSDKEFEEKLLTLDRRKVKHVLYLSNFIKSKGYPEVLKMAKLEKKRCEEGGTRKFHFDFAGGFFKEDDRNYFFNYIKENGLEKYVTYHGVVGGDKKKRLLSDSDIFVLLTSYPKEGQPISILEAIGNGLYIISTAHAAIPDLIGDGENGILYVKDNIEKIYNHMINLKINKKEIRLAYNRIKKIYSKQNYINKLEFCFISS